MRIRRLITSAALIVGLGAAGTNLTACHENLTPYQVCDAFKLSSSWTVINSVFAFGVHYCRAGTASGAIDEYCVFPEGDHWFYRRECNWESQAAEDVLQP